ncbi:polysaccharide lyase family 7 protein [Pontiella sulfatireligans]|uniref:Alginate lyase 2 domain-containing protein n=1 Tax=Pontiella sulfatireligans TaxID=2750658 RepID=A0A6C2UGW0_9BACT|nr:polysaccharide lyase family 7 protein [Pontiella sulfatireligans]VGO19358.1 hypothetical protein SCARR_01416 [Pontiella sulfatireligans]
MTIKRQLYLLLGIALLFGSGLMAGAEGKEHPAEVLDLQLWKLTLPYARENGKKPLEIFQPNLAGFQNPICFFVNKERDGVVFRAHCSEVTTKNSSYPRCELREMAGRKAKRAVHKEKAAWATDDGVLHRMTVTQAITALPPVKSHVVCAQIHDAGDDLIMIRLEDRKLFVERNRFGDVLLDADYELGTRFTVKIEASDGHVRVWYNDVLKMDWERSKKKCYFKAGCYTQSNTSKGDAPESYGEVVIYQLKVEHLSLHE